MSGLLHFDPCSPEGIICTRALAGQYSFPLGLSHWLPFFPVHLITISVFLPSFPKCGNGWVTNGITNVWPLGFISVNVASWVLHCLSKSACKQLYSIRISCTAGVDVWLALCFGVVEFLGHQPHFAGNKGVVCVTVCTVVTVGMEDTAQVHMPGDGWV